MYSLAMQYFFSFKNFMHFGIESKYDIQSCKYAVKLNLK